MHPFIHSMLIHAFLNSCAPHDRLRSDATRVTRAGYPVWSAAPASLPVHSVSARRQDNRSYRGEWGLCAQVLALGGATGVFFAGLASTDELPSTHNEPSSKRLEIVLISRGVRGMAVSSRVAMMPCKSAGSSIGTAFQMLKPSCGCCTTTKMR